MNKDFEALIKLQEIDLRIHELEMSKVEFPHQVSEREAAIAKAQQELDKANALLVQKHDEIRATNDRAAAAREALDKSQERLNSISTNREYDAVHTEIETHKTTVATSSDRLAAIQKDIEQLTGQVAQAQEALQAVKTEHEPVIADLKEKIATIDSRVAAVVEERKVVEAVLPKHVLSQYAFIRRRRANARVLSLVGAARTCAQCHKVLEPQLVNELKRGIKLSACSSCGSILIWTEPVVPLPDEPARAAEESLPEPVGANEPAVSEDDAAADAPIVDDSPEIMPDIEELASESDSH